MNAKQVREAIRERVIINGIFGLYEVSATDLNRVSEILQTPGDDYNLCVSMADDISKDILSTRFPRDIIAIWDEVVL